MNALQFSGESFMQDNLQDNLQDNQQDDPQEYTKSTKKPRKDFTRESRDRKRLGELAETIMLATTTSSIPLLILSGAI